MFIQNIGNCLACTEFTCSEKYILFGVIERLQIFCDEKIVINKSHMNNELFYINCLDNSFLNYILINFDILIQSIEYLEKCYNPEGVK